MFNFTAKVYYEDTDAEGVVYYANYLKYFERARTEWLLDKGLSLNKLKQDQGICFVVKSVNVDYKRPAVLEDNLLITVSPLKLSHAKMELLQTVFRKNESGEEIELCSAKVVIAAVNLDTHRPVRIPYNLFLAEEELSAI